MQRARGAATVSLGRDGLRDLGQTGSAKAILPHADPDWPEVVFLNTAGGVTSCDRPAYWLVVGAGTDLARKAVVDLAPDAVFLGVESVDLGRSAHGERDWMVTLGSTPHAPFRI